MTSFLLMFRSSLFWFLVTFGNKVTKILFNLCLHFARQDGQNGKKWKENHATKVTKIPTTKRRKYGMYKTQVQLAAFNRICPESLSIASIPYAQKHSHIAWQKVGLYQEGSEREGSKSLEKTHGPLCCCSSSPSISFLKTRQNTTLRGNSIFRAEAS